MRRSVSVRVTVVSLCTSDTMRLSLAPPSDLMPPAWLTMSTASFAAATQPCPICAMLPVDGYSPPMLTGSAAQPRRTHGPNAAAAAPAPAFARKLLRLLRMCASSCVLRIVGLLALDDLDPVRALAGFAAPEQLRDAIGSDRIAGDGVRLFACDDEELAGRIDRETARLL